MDEKDLRDEKDPNGADEGNGGGDEKPEAKYTDADMDAVVEKRLARERAKMEREIRKQIEDEAASEKTEAEKLKEMTELQRAQYEAKKIQMERDELQGRLDLNEQTAIARKELSEADINLGDDLLAMFVSADAEKTSRAIDQIKELWPKAVSEAVQRELKRTPPPADQAAGSVSFGATYAKSYSDEMKGA